MKGQVFYFLVAVVLATGTAFKNYSPGKASWLTGNWKGKKYQVNMGKAWDMDLRMDAKAHVYAVEYPELGCKGVLQVVSLGKNRAVFLERLVNGPCIDSGYVIVTKTSEKYISFACLRDKDQHLASYATLEKQE